MVRATPDSELLAFLAPGLVHQFGNVLLSIQGQAHLLDVDNVDRGRAAIRAAAERGAGGLDVLRHLTGEPASAPQPLATTLERFAELVRVPLREAGSSLELRAPGLPAFVMVDPANVVLLLAETTRRLLGFLPSRSGGHIELDAALVDGAVLTTLRFVRANGTLPFPLPTEELLAGVVATARARNRTVRCATVRMGLSLAFPSWTAGGAARTLAAEP